MVIINFFIRNQEIGIINMIFHIRCRIIPCHINVIPFAAYLHNIPCVSDIAATVIGGTGHHFARNSDHIHEQLESFGITLTDSRLLQQHTLRSIRYRRDLSPQQIVIVIRTVQDDIIMNGFHLLCIRHIRSNRLFYDGLRFFVHLLIAGCDLLCFSAYGTGHGHCNRQAKHHHQYHSFCKAHLFSHFIFLPILFPFTITL